MTTLLSVMICLIYVLPPLRKRLDEFHGILEVAVLWFELFTLHDCFS